MRRILRHRPSPAMVVACIALGVALGGTSVAAVNALPRNSVGTKQLKKNAVTSPKVKNNTITGADVNESSLGQVPSAANAANAAHATNADNATNATNATTAANANALNGLAANGITRVARMATAVTTALPTNPTYATYGPALSITAPAAGFVLVNAEATVWNSGCTTNCNFVGFARHIQSSEGSQVAEDSVFDGYGHASWHWVFAVSAGVNTFDIRLSRVAAGDGGLYGWLADMNAIYSPFGATGGPTPTTPAPSAAKKRP